MARPPTLFHRLYVCHIRHPSLECCERWGTNSRWFHSAAALTVSRSSITEVGKQQCDGANVYRAVLKEGLHGARRRRFKHRPCFRWRPAPTAPNTQVLSSRRRPMLGSMAVAYYTALTSYTFAPKKEKSLGSSILGLHLSTYYSQKIRFTLSISNK